MNLSSLAKTLTKTLTDTLKKSSPDMPPLFFAMGKDSFIFYADLIRAVQMDLTCEMLTSSQLDSVENFAVKGKTIALVFGENPQKTHLENLKKVFLKGGASKVITIYPYAFI